MIPFNMYSLNLFVWYKTELQIVWPSIHDDVGDNYEPPAYLHYEVGDSKESSIYIDA